MNIIHLYNKWCQGSAIDRDIAPPHRHLNEILFPSKVPKNKNLATQPLMEDFFWSSGIGVLLYTHSLRLSHFSSRRALSVLTVSSWDSLFSRRLESSSITWKKPTRRVVVLVH